jgi:hypothetical protein
MGTMGTPGVGSRSGEFGDSIAMVDIKPGYLYI